MSSGWPTGPGWFGLTAMPATRKPIIVGRRNACATAPPSSAAPAASHDTEHAAKPAPEPQKYDVPFAWEVSKTEPLAKTRAFLLDALADNETYRKQGDKYFEAFAAAQATTPCQ